MVEKMVQTQKESTFITALAWILIVLSALSLVMTVYELFIFSLFIDILDSFFDSSTSWWDSMASLWFIAYPLIIIYAFVSAIGLLKRKNWARVSYVVLFGIGIIYSLVMLIYSIIPIGEYLVGFESSGQGPDMFMWSVGVFSILLGIGLCVLYGWLIKRLISEKIKLEFKT